MLNNAVLMGNLTKDPELRYTPAGKAVVNFTIAVNENRKENEHTNFIRCVAWEKSAEFVNQYFKKGSKIIVEGSIKQSTYEDKEGNKREKFEIWIRNINFAGAKVEQNGTGTPKAAQNEAKQAPAEEVTLPGEEMF